MTLSAKATGIVMMTVGVACLSTNDALAKLLTDRYSPIQILFLRNLIALPIAALLVWALRGWPAFRSKRPFVHLVRGLFWVGATVMFFTSIKHLGLATSTALIFLAPLLIVAIAAIFLGERSDWVGWLAVVIGFVGAMIIVQPGAASFDPLMTLPIVAAVMAAFLMISARFVDPDESVWTLLLYLTGSSALISAVVVPFVWEPLIIADLWLFVGAAVFGTAGMTLMTQAFRLAPASVVAPLDYTALVWAILLGWGLFGTVPAATTLLGGVVIAAAGLITIFHNRT